MARKPTADEVRREQTRETLKEESKQQHNRRFKIDISETERHMLTRPLERLKPHERTPNEKALLEFLVSLSKYQNGAIIKSPGPKKRVRKLTPTTNKRPTAAQAVKKMKPVKKSDKKGMSPSPKKKRRATWRD